MCTACKTHGHQHWTDPSTRPERTPLTEEQRDERRLVIESNAAGRSAETVRRSWLPNIAARKTPPKGAVEFVAHVVIAHGAHLDKAALGGHRRAARPLGFTKDIGGGRYLGDLLARATSPRAQVIALVVALATIEETTSVQCWREPQTGSMTAS